MFIPIEQREKRLAIHKRAAGEIAALGAGLNCPIGDHGEQTG
jgi:hypothetical protein